MDACLLLLLLYLAPSWTQVEFYDYERRLKYQVSAYDWSYEEVPDYLKSKTKSKPEKRYWDTHWDIAPYAVGIRGLYANDKYLYQRCMGLLVQKYYVITFCSCVCTWYASNRIDEKRKGVGVIQTPKNCDKHYDIRSGQIFTFFQYEIKRKDSEEPSLITNSFEVSTFEVPSSSSCDAAIDSPEKTLKLYVSFVILVLNKAEVDHALRDAITNMNPPWPPVDNLDRLEKIIIISYGAQLEDGFSDIDENGKSYMLEHRPITVRVTENSNPYACHRFSYREDEGKCFQVSFKEVCGFLAGSPLVGKIRSFNDHRVIGLVSNHMSCYVGRTGAVGPVNMIPLTRVMEQWTNFEAQEATEKDQYDVKDVPWNDETTPTYLDQFPPDSLKHLIDTAGEKAKAQAASSKIESITVIISFIVLCAVYNFI